jgi:hypothetical protein
MDENFKVIENCITEIVEMEKYYNLLLSDVKNSTFRHMLQYYNVALLLPDGKNIMLKNGKKIVLYNIKNDKVTAFKNAYISYDMMYVLEDITDERELKVFSVRYNKYLSIDYPSSSGHKFFFFSNNVICFHGYSNIFDKYGYDFYEKCDNYFDLNGRIEFEKFSLSRERHKKEYKKYEKFISDLESVSYNDSFTTKNNEKLQIVVNNNSIDIKNLSTNKIYRSLKTNNRINKITSANFTNDGNVIVLLYRTKVLLWDISK